jgi:hypothetical protein
MEDYDRRAINSKGDRKEDRTVGYRDKSGQASEKTTQSVGPKPGSSFALGLLAGFPSAFKPNQKSNGQGKTKALKYNIGI